MQTITRKFVTLEGELADRVGRFGDREHRNFKNAVEKLLQEALDARGESLRE